MKSVGFDIDFTITDPSDWITEQFLYWWKEIMHKGNYTGSVDTSKMGYGQRYNFDNEHEKRLFEEWMWPNGIKNSPVRKGTKETFEMLQVNGYEVHIVTRRSTNPIVNNRIYTGGMLRLDTLDWFKKNNLNPDRIHFDGTNKLKIMEDFKIDILVDDDLINLTKVCIKKPVIIMNNPWNKDANIPNSTRISEFEPEEFYRIIENIIGD